MVVATITVSGHTGLLDIAVEVLGKGPHPGTAWVQALNGLQPFTRHTHGGPCQEDCAVVSIARLRNVRMALETRPVEEVQLALPAGWFPELEDALANQRSGGRLV